MRHILEEDKNGSDGLFVILITLLKVFFFLISNIFFFKN